MVGADLVRGNYQEAAVNADSFDGAPDNVSLANRLKAFELAHPHTPNADTAKQFLTNRMDVAECILDWAMERQTEKIK